jgi:hypothetical protein
MIESHRVQCRIERPRVPEVPLEVFFLEQLLLGHQVNRPVCVGKLGRMLCGTFVDKMIRQILAVQVLAGGSVRLFDD